MGSISIISNTDWLMRAEPTYVLKTSAASWAACDEDMTVKEEEEMGYHGNKVIYGQ